MWSTLAISSRTPTMVVRTQIEGIFAKYTIGIGLSGVARRPVNRRLLPVVAVDNRDTERAIMAGTAMNCWRRRDSKRHGSSANRR